MKETNGKIRKTIISSNNPSDKNGLVPTKKPTLYAKSLLL
jgi:hypothetical protein